MTELILQGPFLTRRQAAARIGLPPAELVGHPELLRVSGLLEECYFAFQCRADAVGTDIGRVVLAVRSFMTDLQIADWLVRQEPNLKETSPLEWLEHRWGSSHVLKAAEHTLGASRQRGDSKPGATKSPTGGPAVRRETARADLQYSGRLRARAS
jgi:hypothetical protein